MEYYIKPGATTIVQYIAQRNGAAHCQHAELHLLEGVQTDSVCN